MSEKYFSKGLHDHCSDCKKVITINKHGKCMDCRLKYKCERCGARTSKAGGKCGRCKHKIKSRARQYLHDEMALYE